MTFTTDVKKFQRHKHGGMLYPMLHWVVDDTLVKAFPLFRNALLQLPILDLHPVK